MKLHQALRIKKGEVIALTGGGGKTTAMFCLAAELAQSDPLQRVLTTTSTRIFASQLSYSPAYTTFNAEQQNIEDILPALKKALDKHAQVLLTGNIEPVSNKAFGIDPSIVDRLAAHKICDVIINEADGSRMRPFKAPASHEPAIPTHTTLVVPLVGLDILGQPLADEAVHRPNLVSQLSGTDLGKPVTPETVVSVLGHPEGGLKNVLFSARYIPLLNKIDLPNTLPLARQIATILLNYQAIDAVAIGSVENRQQPITELWGRTAAIILAAGAAKRFGSPKQLASWGEQTFLEQVVDIALASQADPVIVVLGAETEQSQRLLSQKLVEVVINRDWAMGQSRSMQKGLALLPDNINSAIFLLVDQPGIKPSTINMLIQHHRETLAPVIWPEFEGQRGNPVLFDRQLFPELMKVQGDVGGKPVLKKHKAEGERVLVRDEGILQDFDRPEDL